jgi:hypothetical protein
VVVRQVEMSNGTEKVISGWTVDTLKIYHDTCIAYEAKLAAERDKRYAERFAAQEAATAYMRQITNEFRGQLSDQQATFITRTETLARAQSNADKIDSLATRLDRTEGRSGGLNAGWVYLIAGVGLLITVVNAFLMWRK